MLPCLSKNYLSFQWLPACSVQCLPACHRITCLSKGCLPVSNACLPVEALHVCPITSLPVVSNACLHVTKYLSFQGLPAYVQCLPACHRIAVLSMTAFLQFPSLPACHRITCQPICCLPPVCKACLPLTEVLVQPRLAFLPCCFLDCLLQICLSIQGLPYCNV